MQFPAASAWSLAVLFAILSRMRSWQAFSLCVWLSLPTHALSPQADRKIIEGLDAGYSLNFEHAASLFEEANQLAPQHPAGPFFLASLQWFEYSQNADIPGTIDALEPKFNRNINEAFNRAQKMYRQNPKDPEANFYLGAAYGMKGRWLLLKRHWIRAAHNGYKGYKYLKRTIELDPNLYDAYLGLGMYDYYSDTLPGILKFASRLIVRGDKKRGLRYINLTIEKGHYSVTEAKLFLAAVEAAYEHEPQKALLIIRELKAEKHDNLFFNLMEVGFLSDAKDWSGAIALGEPLVYKVWDVPYAKPHASLFDLYLGDAYLGAKDYGKAIEIFNRCIEIAPDPRKASVTFCYLRRAQAYDLMGNRGQAIEDYRSVKARPDFFDSQAKARQGLKGPATYDQVLSQLLE